MRVIKRNEECEDVSFDKVLNRLKKLSSDLNINVSEIAQKVCTRIYDGVKTCELDELAAYLCSSMSIDNPDYSTLASRIIVSNHHKNTSPSFSETIQILYNNKDVHGNDSPLVSDDLYEVVSKNKEKLTHGHKVPPLPYPKTGTDKCGQIPVEVLPSLSKEFNV